MFDKSLVSFPDFSGKERLITSVYIFLHPTRKTEMREAICGIGEAKKACVRDSETEGKTLKINKESKVTEVCMKTNVAGRREYIL